MSTPYSQAAIVADTNAIQTVHTAVPGRARFQVEGLRRNSRLQASIEERLGRRAGIVHVQASVLTGNTLVRFDTALPLEEVQAWLEDLVREAGQNANGGPGTQAGPMPSVRPTLASLLSGLRGSLGQERNGTDAATGEPQPAPPQPWHLLSSSGALAFAGTSARFGLSPEEAQARLARYGPNSLPEAKARSILEIFLNQFASLPVLLLLGSAALSVATGGVADALVILAVVFLNAGIGTVTEQQSERTISALTRIGQPSATVIRAEIRCPVAAPQVVPGDLLVLNRGDYVAADARLIESVDLSIDESVLTGESIPATKTLAALSAKDLPLGDRTNMVFRGTVVTGGSGLAVVSATGLHTEIGRVQAMIASAEQPELPIERQLAQLGRQMVYVAVTACAGVFLIGILRGYRFLAMLQSSVSLAVSAIPEGLPTVATMTLAFGVQKMRDLNVLVRHLEAIEALGAAQIICLDKTGTITMNRMAVVSAYAGSRRYSLLEHRFLRQNQEVEPSGETDLRRLCEICVLCNETKVQTENGALVLDGSPTEAALVQMAVDGGVDVPALRQSHPLRDLLHRTETRNYMVTMHDSEDGGMLVAVKGNPLEVLELATHALRGGRVRKLTPHLRTEIRTVNEQMAGSALRVLGVAYQARDNPEVEGIPGGLIWVGLAGIFDPPREGLRDLIATFRRAGVRTIMITGDQSITAYAIGKELDLSHGRPIEMIDSTELDRLDPEMLSALASRAHIFARVNPAHKLQIVRALSASGAVVAMTGDGINDGPALKVADIGIAMGKGAEAAREVADVVLLDDNILTLAAAIRQGRATHDDIRKAVHFITATNLSEILVMFLGVAAGFEQPLNPRQLLWINLLTDVFPELALAVEPPEEGIMSRPPRDPSTPIVSARDFSRLATESAIITAATLGAFGYGVRKYGPGPAPSTMAFLTLSSAQLLDTITARSETHSIFDATNLPANRYVPAALGTGFAIELLSEFLPLMRSMLGTVRLPALDLLVCGGAAVSSFLLTEILKFARLRRQRQLPFEEPPVWPADYDLESVE